MVVVPLMMTMFVVVGLHMLALERFKLELALKRRRVHPICEG